MTGCYEVRRHKEGTIFMDNSGGEVLQVDRASVSLASDSAYPEEDTHLRHRRIIIKLTLGITAFNICDGTETLPK